MIEPEDIAELAAAFIAHSWEIGDLDYKRHAGQRQLRDAANNVTSTIGVLHAARGYGKTFDALVECCERGRKYRNHRMVFAAPTREDARKITAAVMPMVIDDAPQHLKPVWRASDHCWAFPGTDAQLIIEGADDDKGNHLRGPHIHYCVGDEVGFWRHAAYVVKSILLPQIQRVKGKMRLQSTSPESVGHDFVGLCEEAIRNGAYTKFTVFDNPRLTREQIQKDAEEMSGVKGDEVWKKTNVRREFLCEFVTDTERAVIPEWSELVVIDDYKRPTWVDTYTFLDLGLVDLTHALFAHWDFERAKLVIEDELALQYERTKDFAAKCAQKERDLWGEIPYFGNVSHQSHNRAPWGRYSDNDAQILHDLGGYGLTFAPAIKVEKEVALNRLRVAFAQGKIEIHRRCVNLIHQLRVGVWNERRTDYERIPGAGHLDGIDALIYGWRMMDMSRNPIPPMLGVYSATHHVPEYVRRQSQITKNEMAKLLRR